jgi:Fe2+ transport system protein FeoA
VFSGMFGRLFVDLGTRQQLHVPVTAVRQLGQIDQAVVIDGQRAMHRRFVVLGEHSGDQVEVISGLAAGEIVVADASALRRDAGR